MFKTPIHDTFNLRNTNKIINDFLPERNRRNSSRIIKIAENTFWARKDKKWSRWCLKFANKESKDTENYELDINWRFGFDLSWKLLKSSRDLIDNSHSISSKFNYVLWRTKHAKCHLHMHSHCRVIMIAFIARGNIDYNFSPARKIDLILSVSNSFIINERQFAICDCLSTWKIAGEDFSRNKKHENRLEVHKSSAENSRVWWSCEHIAVGLLFRFLHCHFRFTENFIRRFFYVQSVELNSQSHQNIKTHQTKRVFPIKNVFANKFRQMRATLWIGCVDSSRV